MLSDPKIEEVVILLSEDFNISTLISNTTLHNISTLLKKYENEKQTFTNKKISIEKIKLCINKLNSTNLTSKEILELSGAKNLSILTFQINNYLKRDNLKKLIKRKRSGQTVYCLEISSSVE